MGIGDPSVPAHTSSAIHIRAELDHRSNGEIVRDPPVPPRQRTIPPLAQPSASRI
jgi:hypothetical protein